MLEQVGEPGLAEFLVLRADVVPDVDGDDGRLAVFMNDQGEPVVEHELFVRDVDFLGMGRNDKGCKQQRSDYGTQSATQSIHGKAP